MTLTSTASATTQVGQSYSQTNVALGGTSPYTYSVSAGTVPAGTTLNTGTGTVSGTPTTAGAFSYTIKVTDSTTPTAMTATQTVSGTITPATLTLTSTASPTTMVGQSYSQANVAMGGTTPYTYSVSAGTVPAGTTLNAGTGTVSGTPTTAGAFSYTIKVTDSTTPTAMTATQTVSGTITSGTTATTLISSLNPSRYLQPVTFTATVTGNSPTGTVTFFDGATQIGTGTVSGGKATFTTASLSVGTHSITAKYNGDANNSSSPSATLSQSVSIASDSVNLRTMQIRATQQGAQISGQAISSAFEGAIQDGFNNVVESITPNGSGFTFHFVPGEPGEARSGTGDSLRDFVAAPDQALSSDQKPSRLINDEFAALGYAGNLPTKAPPSPNAPASPWMGWIDLRGISVYNNSVGNDLEGNQVNLTVGITHKLTPDFLVGLAGGYEYLDYSSDALNSRLTGQGWTVGGYLGWRFWPGLVFDIGVARTDVSYDGTAGAAAATFPGSRWLVSGGLTGTYHWDALVVQPSARVYGLWEHDSGYTDSLGAAQADNDFSTGRASSGAKFSYPFVWTPSVAAAPYAGVYGDYYFTGSDAAVAGLPTPALLLQGWSARFTSGLDMRFSGGQLLTFGGQLGGIGSSSDTKIWTYQVRGSVPF